MKIPSKVGARNFCSSSCRQSFFVTGVVCEICGKTFDVYRSIANKARFCSIECRSRGMVDNSKKSMPPFEERFWSKVDKSNGPEACWHWTANSSRYGRIKRDGKSFSTHRISWELCNGPIPDGMAVCHACDNPLCVNPSHLFLGTSQDNIDDKVAKNRQAAGDSHGRAKLTIDDVHEIRRRYGDGGISYKALSLEYGVSEPAIGNIIRGKTWRCVEREVIRECH